MVFEIELDPINSPPDDEQLTATSIYSFIYCGLGRTVWTNLHFGMPEDSPRTMHICASLTCHSQPVYTSCNHYATREERHGLASAMAGG